MQLCRLTCCSRPVSILWNSVVLPTCCSRCCVPCLTGHTRKRGSCAGCAPVVFEMLWLLEAAHGSLQPVRQSLGLVSRFVNHASITNMHCMPCTVCLVFFVPYLAVQPFVACACAPCVHVSLNYCHLYCRRTCMLTCLLICCW